MYAWLYEKLSSRSESPGHPVVLLYLSLNHITKMAFSMVIQNNMHQSGIILWPPV